MAYREVTMLDVKEALRLWLGGVPKKRIALQLLDDGGEQLVVEPLRPRIATQAPGPRGRDVASDGLDVESPFRGAFRLPRGRTPYQGGRRRFGAGQPACAWLDHCRVWDAACWESAASRVSEPSQHGCHASSGRICGGSPATTRRVPFVVRL